MILNCDEESSNPYRVQSLSQKLLTISSMYQYGRSQFIIDIETTRN